MAIQQVALLFLVSFSVVLAQSPHYELRVGQISTVTSLACYEPSIGHNADIDDVTFWRNRTLTSNPQGLREGSDMPVFADLMENKISFILTREFEGYYTCGRQMMDRIEESPTVPLVCKSVILLLILTYEVL